MGGCVAALAGMAIIIVISYVGYLARSTPAGTNTPAAEGGYSIRVIDGCEYIECDYGIFDNRVFSLTHKGNCSNPIHQYKAEK